MKLAGKRIKLHKWIQTDEIAVRVLVEAVIPDEDPSEPCFEASVVRWMEQVQWLADAGELEALAKLGEVYVRRSA